MNVTFASPQAAREAKAYWDCRWWNPRSYARTEAWDQIQIEVRPCIHEPWDGMAAHNIERAFENGSLVPPQGFTRPKDWALFNNNLGPRTDLGGSIERIVGHDRTRDMWLTDPNYPRARDLLLRDLPNLWRRSIPHWDLHEETGKVIRISKWDKYHEEYLQQVRRDQLMQNRLSQASSSSTGGP